MTEKNKGKKLLTLTLALSMTLALPPAGVYAEEDAADGGFVTLPAMGQPVGLPTGDGEDAPKAVVIGDMIGDDGEKDGADAPSGGQNDTDVPPPSTDDGSEGKTEETTTEVDGGKTEGGNGGISTFENEGGEDETPVVNEKTIYVSNEGTGDGTLAENPTTLKEAIAEINGYTKTSEDENPMFVISLTGNLNIDVGSNDLELKKYTTTLLGNGHSIESTRTIMVTGENTKLYLGKPDGTDKLTINVNVTYSSTLGIEQGANLYMYDGVIIKHSPNEALSRGAVQLNNGGNFYMYGGEISDCITAMGTIFADNESHVTISGGTIQNNKATYAYAGGGAVHLQENSTLIVDGTKNKVVFENNKSAGRGGAIRALGGSVSISGKTVFKNNSVAEKKLAGAIYIQYGSLKIDGATFEGNSALYGAAIVTLGGSSAEQKATATLSNCTFNNNVTQADGVGGAIYSQDTGVTLTDCTIENNKAGEVAGGIFFTGYSEELNKLTLNGKNLIQNNTVTVSENEENEDENQKKVFDSNLYLNTIEPKEGEEGESVQLQLIVGENFDGSNIGISMDSIENIAKGEEKPEASVPFSIDFKKNCGTTYPSQYFFSDNPEYHVDWSEDRNEARLVKGAPEYNLSVSPNLLDFGSTKEGYTTAPEAKTVTIKNVGNMPVTVTLPNDSDYIFTPGENWNGRSVTIPVGGSATFTVQPATGLSVGDYKQKINLTTDCGIAPEVAMQFTVTKSGGGGGGHHPKPKPTVEIPDDDALGLNNTDHFAYIVGYGHGDVQPQNSITRAEVAAIFFRLLEDGIRSENFTHQNDFSDVAADAWYCSSVSTLSRMGIIAGYPDGTFRPNAPITRAEFAAIATRFDNNGDKTPVNFSDIIGHWAEGEITVAANHGWVSGYGDGTFRPESRITRAETMSLVNRVLKRIPETPEDLLPDMITWTDNTDTSSWYYLPVQEATNSHYYEFKDDSKYEKWTELRETRDWSKLG